MHTSEAPVLASPEQIEALHARLFELVEKVTHNLYRHTLERLKRINPTLDEVAGLCEALIELLQNAGNSQIRQMNEAVTVIREAALAVGRGDERTVTDCAYHIEEVIRLYRAGN
jgi:hypothetical protein